MQVEVKRENEYVPNLAVLKNRTDMTELETLFEFEFKDKDLQDHFHYKPGQFVQLSMFGIGEAPFSISSTPTRPGTIELGIRRAGDVTEAIHRLEVGDVVGLRGPYGNGFPLEKMKGKDILIVAGGIGLVPLRSVINYIIDEREDFGHLTLFYGACLPEERIFVDELENNWPSAPDVDVLQTVDECHDTWMGNVGVVTTLFDKYEVDSENTVALICGPPVMYRFVVKELLDLDFRRDEIYMSLERRMKCGVGKCAHCQVGHKLVCKDGPVFTYFEVQRLQGAI
jgi:sulfhydrogenase subunit gamma (sulfur reductase)